MNAGSAFMMHRHGVKDFSVVIPAERPFGGGGIQVNTARGAGTTVLNSSAGVYWVPLSRARQRNEKAGDALVS
jgi:hypothetical protein